jgi:TonB family protein
VASVLRFPKRLALMLEQGETVVQFVVRADGRLQGSVKVVKSAGFAEFDQEAVAAVTRAAPFPAVGHPLSVSMPIAFDNPVVR